MDFNSVENQSIKRRFVDQNVIGCFTYGMEQLLNAGMQVAGDFPQFEDIENCYIYNHNGELLNDEERADLIEELNEKLDNLDPGEAEDDGEDDGEADDIEHEIELLESEIEDLEELEQEPQEIFEWWAVSRYLAEKLSNYNEPVLEYGNNYYWGRTCTGQAILLDSPISNICNDMGILEGQPNSWAK